MGELRRPGANRLTMRSPRRIAKGVLRRLARRLAQWVAPTELQAAIAFLERSSGAVFPKKNLVVVDRVPQGPVLVLSPHPDDEAIGMGGTLAMHVANGSPVTVVYLTDGGGLGEDRAQLIATRRREARSLGESLGLQQVFLDNEDTRLMNDAASVERIEALLRELDPVSIYSPSIFDTHFDHFATNRVLADALGRHQPSGAMVAGYEVWNTIPFPNWLVDVSQHAEERERILAHYATPMQYTDFALLVRSRTSVHYTLHVDSRRETQGKGFAEAFQRYEPETFRELFRAWSRVLAERGDELPRRLAPTPPPA